MIKTHLVTGGCGFIGQNLVRRLLCTTNDRIILIDNLGTGLHPIHWLGLPQTSQKQNVHFFGIDKRVVLIKTNILSLMSAFTANHNLLDEICGLHIGRIHDFYHFAAIVGGRNTIDNFPIAVAQNLAFDAATFNWACSYLPQKMLYPSSSAAYPIDLQSEQSAVRLCEHHIDFSKIGLPDNTYGWAKLTGEMLARTASKNFGLHVTCIRPFSGYGENQDITYPISALASRAALFENPFEVWGNGMQQRDFIHIDDVLDCALLAMDKISDGSAVNVGTGRVTSFLEVIKILTDYAGYKPEIVPLLDKPTGVYSRVSDMSHTENLLGWTAKITLEEGLKRVYEKVKESIYSEASSAIATQYK